MPRFHPRTRRIPRPSSRAALALVAAIAFAACDDPVGTVPGDSPLAGLELYVPYPSHASRQADEWRDTRPEDAAAMERIAREPQGVWLTEADPVPQIQTTLDAAESDGSTPLYYYTVYHDGEPFAVDAQGTRRPLDGPRWLSAKAAYGWHALLPDDYTARVVETVAPAFADDRGWFSGVYEGSHERAGSMNVNTAAVILEALLYRRTGRPLLDP